MIWRSQASFRVWCVVLTVAIALPSFATLSFAGSKRSRVLHAHPTTNIGTVSATSTAAAAPAQILRPRFDAPPLFAANGRNVGIGGLYSMAKGDFNGDGIPARTASAIRSRFILETVTALSRRRPLIRRELVRSTSRWAGFAGRTRRKI